VPSKCLFVDDLIENVNGAVKAEIAAHLFDGDYNKLEDRLRDMGVILN